MTAADPNANRTHNEDEPVPAPKGVDVTRRRFVTGGAASVPILATLMSRPAFANVCTISGTLSNNLSVPSKKIHCSGYAPSWWASNPKSWPQFNPGVCNPMATNGPSYYSLIDCTKAVQKGWDPTAAKVVQVNQLQATSFKEGVGLDKSACPGGASYTVPRPDSENSVGGGTGGTQNSYGSSPLPNQPLTLMQALWSGNDCLAHYAAAVLNAARFGEAYGYSQLQMQELIVRRNGDPKFLSDLKLLNGRAS